MLPYLFALGSLSVVAAGSGREESDVADAAIVQRLGVTILFGLLLNHVLALLLSDLKIALLAGAALGAASLGCLVRMRSRFLRSLISPRLLFPVLLISCASIYFVAVDPIDGWDARSVWFFHGKMMFHHNSIHAGGDWALRSIAEFSHTDYPELVPIIAAQLASVAGYWNEYLPKIALAALLVPALLLLLPLLCRKWRYMLFLPVPLLFTAEWLKNGYMDGYLALYAGLAAFYIGRWLQEGKRLDLVSGILAAGICLDMKNEGMLFLVIVCFASSVFLLVRKIRKRVLPTLRWRQDLLLLLVTLSGWVLWGRVKRLHHLHNDLQLGFKSLGLMQNRLAEGSLGVILEHLYLRYGVHLSLGIFLIALVASLRGGKRPGTGALFCLLVAIVYFTGIVVIYLATPYDLFTFQLPSGNRTMLPVHLLLLASSLSLFSPAADEDPAR